MSLKDVQLNRGHLQIEERPLYTGGGEGGGREGGEGGRRGGREGGGEGEIIFACIVYMCMYTM